VYQTAFLGDVVLLTPLLRAIRAAFPRAPLGAVVIPQCREVVEGLVDQVILIDKRGGNGEVYSQAIEKIKAFAPDVAFIPHRSIRSGRLLKLAGIPVRIGFDKGGGSYWHTKKVHYQEGLYEGERNLALLSPLTLQKSSSLPTLNISPQSEQNVMLLMDKLALCEREFVVIAPASVWKTKTWSSSHYRDLGEQLLINFGLKTVAVGGKEDFAVCESSVVTADLNLAGQLSPLESAGLMSKSRLVVSGDSAAAHLATGVGAKQVIIFGSTAPRYGFLPSSVNVRAVGLDLWCRPCSDHGRRKCPLHIEPECLEQITHKMVLSMISDWVAPNIESS